MHIVGPALGIALALANILDKDLVSDVETEAATPGLTAPVQRGDANGPDPGALAAENAALKTDLARARIELAALRAQTATAKPMAACQQEATPPTAADFAASVENWRRAEVEGTLALKQAAETTAAAFLSEATESGWAGRSAAAIYDAWQQHQPEGATLIDLQCRSTLCRVEIEYTRRAVAGDIEGKLLDDLSLLFNASQRQTESTPGEGEYERVVLYLTRAT